MDMGHGTRWIARLLGLAALLSPLSGIGQAQAGNRSVTIIEGVEEPLPEATPPAADAQPLADLRTDNPAGMTLRILPNADLVLGTQIALTLSTGRPGYLVIVDINADGRVTQIYPNMLSLSRSSGDVATANLIKPGPPVTIPNLKNPLARFVFKADPPPGSGAIVAILSDRPVQIIDLPEKPGSPPPLQASVDMLTQSVSALQIASGDNSGTFSPGTWSFVAVPYRIR